MLCRRFGTLYAPITPKDEVSRWAEGAITALCGLRSISNVVDITNHTLLEMESAHAHL